MLHIAFVQPTSSHVHCVHHPYHYHSCCYITLWGTGALNPQIWQWFSQIHTRLLLLALKHNFSLLLVLLQTNLLIWGKGGLLILKQHGVYCSFSLPSIHTHTCISVLLCWQHNTAQILYYTSKVQHARSLKLFIPFQ